MWTNIWVLSAGVPKMAYIKENVQLCGEDVMFPCEICVKECVHCICIWCRGLQDHRSETKETVKKVKHIT